MLAISTYVGNLTSTVYEETVEEVAVPPGLALARLGSTGIEFTAGAHQPLAVASYACRTGGNNGVLSLTGVDASCRVPYDRWDVDAHEGLFGGLPVQFGVFLQGIETFDAAAFGVSGPEAALMDPQQRLLLSCTAEALMTADTAAGSAMGLSGVGMVSGTGTFVGVSSMDYNKVSMKYTAQVTPYTSTGASLSVAAGRVSYTFNLKGPAISVDTACSSSLVATHAAFNAINLQQCKAAVAAGVNLMLSPDTPAAFQKAGMLAPDGRCKTLDAAADGYVRGEAVGVLLLMPLGMVEAGGQLPAVLLGSAVNQDGRSSALTAPNGPSQQEVIGAALKAAGLEPGQVSATTLTHFALIKVYEAVHTAYVSRGC